MQCKFDDGFRCGYDIGSGDSEFQWVRNTGQTPSLDTGPTVDGTNFSPQGIYKSAAKESTWLAFCYIISTFSKSTVASGLNKIIQVCNRNNCAKIFL